MGSFSLFMCNVSSGPELSFTFSRRHMENITVNVLDEPKYCYGFSPRNFHVLTQLLNVHRIFKDINHKVSPSIHLCEVTDITTQIVLG